MADVSENNSTRSKKKFFRIFLFALAVIFLLLLRFTVTGEEKDFNKIMEHTASELNKTCPQKVDEDTRLDSASVHLNKTFRYNYTLLHLNKDSMDVELFAYSVKPLMINNAKTNRDLQLFRDNNVTLEYYFRDEHGNFMTRIEVLPEEYIN